MHITAVLCLTVLLVCASGGWGLSSKGRTFYTSFIKTYRIGGMCRLYVIASETTQVRVYAPWVSVDVTSLVKAGQMETFDLPVDIRTTGSSGVENKGVHVQAYTGDVQVYALNIGASYYAYGDVKEVLPAATVVDEGGFMVLSHNSSISPYAASTLTVVAHEDNTYVQVFRQSDDVVQPQLLQKLDTYTYTAPTDGDDVSGFRVTSQEVPVSVTAGHGQTSICASYSGHIESTFVPTTAHSYVHIVPLIVGLETVNNRVLLRVTSSSGTDININGSCGMYEEAHIHAGLFHEHLITQDLQDTYRVVTCSSRCLVTRYVVTTSISTTRFIFPSMHPVTPVTRFTDDTWFTTVAHPGNKTMQHYLGIVAETKHISSLRLNGGDFQLIVWTKVDNTDYSVTSFPLAENLYHLWGVNGSQFAAYVHGFSIRHWFGYGFAAGTGGDR